MRAAESATPSPHSLTAEHVSAPALPTVTFPTEEHHDDPGDDSRETDATGQTLVTAQQGSCTAPTLSAGA